MTINELLTEVDDLKPNQYDDKQKIRWINQVEGKIIKEILETHEPDPEYEDIRMKPEVQTGDSTENNDVETVGDESTENTEEESKKEEPKVEQKEEAGWQPLCNSAGVIRPKYEFKGYDENTNMDTELLVKEPYTDLYKFYLMGMINLQNEEYDRYQNAAVLFNNAYRDFANYWNQTHRSVYPARFRT